MGRPKIKSEVDKLLTTGEVCAITGLSVDKIRRAADSGDLPCFKFGTHRRFDRKKVEAWIKRHEHIIEAQGGDDESNN